MNGRRLVLLVVFIVSALLQPFVLGVSVNAQASVSNSTTRVNNYAITRMFADCFEGSKLHQDVDKVKGSELFYDSRAIANTLSLSEDIPVGNVFYCGDSTNAVSRLFMRTFNIDPVDFVCEAGYVRDNGWANCKTGDSNFTSSTSGYKAAIKKYTGIDIDNPLPDVSYWYYLTYWKYACTMSEITSSEYYKNKDTVTNQKFYDLPATDDANPAKLIHKYYKSKVDHNGRYYDRLSNYVKCSDTTLPFTSLVQSFRQYYAVETYCNSTNDILGVAAQGSCTEGLANKDNPGFCYEYATTAEYMRTGQYTIPEDSDEYTDCAIGQAQPIIPGSNLPVGLYCYEKYRGQENEDDLVASCTRGAMKIACQSPYDGYDRSLYEACTFGSTISSEQKYHLDGIAANFGTPTGEVDCIVDPNNVECKAPVSSCAIDGIGFILCPALTFVAGVADSAYAFLADNFLSIPTGFLKMDSSNATFNVWRQFVTIANVLFVIGFLIIIFSQLTGVGVSNYGVKKLLPRLILAAILINLSFVISALATDLSNILGYSLKSFLSGLAGSATSDLTTKVTSGTATGDGWMGIVGTVLLAGGVGAVAVGASGGITLALVALVGILAMVVIALIGIFFALQVRQVVIILLIVLSPLAFAAYLLPNTAQWFTKWRKLFTSMLLLFPIVGVVYGASSLAAEVIKSLYADAGIIGDDVTKTIGQIIGEGVRIIPLFVVPLLLKRSLEGIGSLGSTINSLGSKLGGGARSGISNSGVAKALKGRSALTSAQTGAGIYSGKNPFRRAGSFVNGKLNKSDAFNRLTGDYGTARGATIEKLEADEIKSAESAAKLKARSGKEQDTIKAQYEAALRSGDITRARATQNILMGMGGPGVNDARSILEKVNNPSGVAGAAPALSENIRRAMANNITEHHAVTAKTKSNDLLTWAAKTQEGSTANLTEIAGSNDTWSKLTATDLVQQNDDAFLAAMKSGGVSVATMEALNDVRLASQLSDKKRAHMSEHVLPPKAP